MSARLARGSFSYDPPRDAKRDIPRIRFRDYETVSLLGRGGMGSVFKARHLQLGHFVAIKCLHATLATNGAQVERFLREGRILARLRHPHIVRVFDVGSTDGLPFLIMELLEGVKLSTALRREGPLAIRSLANVLLPVASAVAAGHRLGILHRDLKPSNVMCSPNHSGGLSPCLFDFGVSRERTPGDHELDITRSDALLGTIPYMSPEQTRGPQHVDERTDQYALGVMLYECATGRRPFRGETPYSLMHAIANETLVPPSVVRASLPPEFDAVVLRAMSRDPALRFPSVVALGEALLPFADPKAHAIWSEEFEAGRRPPNRSSARRAPRANRSVACKVGLLVVAVAVVSMVVLRTRSAGHLAEASVSGVRKAAAPTPSAPAETAPVRDPATALALSFVPSATPTSAAPLRRSPRIAAKPPESPGTRALGAADAMPTVEPVQSPPRVGTNLAPILE